MLKRHWPLFIAFGCAALSIAVTLGISLQITHGHFGYTLDDAYIHMAIAKNFSNHGIWGVTRYGFTSCATSVSWVLALSTAYYLFGVNEITPFVFTCISAFLLLYVAYRILRKNKVSSLFICATLLALILLTPMTPLVFSGMEHLLHALLTLMFVYRAVRMLCLASTPTERFLVFLLGAGLTSVRYEGIMLTMFVTFLFLCKREWVFALKLFFTSWIPVTLYGLLSLINGWRFLPSSVFLKASLPNLHPGSIIYFLKHTYSMVLEIHVLVLLVAVGILFIYHILHARTFWDRNVLVTCFFLMITLMHLVFGRIVVGFRYEAYIMVLGVVTLVVAIPMKEFSFYSTLNWWKTSWITGVVLVLLFPLARRGWGAFGFTTHAIRNNYEQQYQMGLFLQRFFPGTCVAANDIGAINYLAEINCVDLTGLMTIEIAEAIVKKTFTTEMIEEIALRKNIRLALIYDSWFTETRIPNNWVRLGEWVISDNVICGSSTVSIYCTSSSETDAILNSLRLFSKSLPSTVKQYGYYTRGLVLDQNPENNN